MRLAILLTPSSLRLSDFVLWFSAKQKLLDERHYLVQEGFKITPAFKPPSDYRPSQTKYTRKIYIPHKEYYSYFCSPPLDE